MRLSLQPLTDIHLHSNYGREIEPNGNLAYVYIFSAIAFIILLIACINFMNLATARSTQRAKEVGIRKVLGAHRGLLIKQFLGESVLFSVLALLLAMGLVALFLPAFNALADKQLAVRYLDNSGYLWGLLGIALFVGVFAGSYPAIILSSFRPIHVLKGLLAGRDFSRDFATDVTEGFILNEAAVHEFEWGSSEEAVGKQFRCCGNDRMGKIIGVVKDFHHLSPHQTIEPAALMVRASWFNYLSVRISTENVVGVLGALESSWHGLVPGRPFDYFFLDEDYDHQYRTERQLGTIMSIFSLFALLVACLGLFGLASYMAEQRTKEIGIRKVLGASVRSIVFLLSQAFFKLIVLAFVVAVPIAYFVTSRWLQDFAYRIEMGVGLFVLAGLLALLVALLTVSYQAIKAALNNPVESLRYE